jgi:site-specific recombinase XerD
MTHLKQIPSLEEFFILLMSENTSVISKNVILLLHSILKSPKYFIKTVPNAEFDNILKLSKNTGKISSRPTSIFKINYAEG